MASRPRRMGAAGKLTRALGARARAQAGDVETRTLTPDELAARRADGMARNARGRAADLALRQTMR